MAKMKKLIICILWLLPMIPFAQNDEAFVDQQVLEFTEDLKAKGVVQYFVYKSYCEGETQMIKLNDKLCISKGTFYQSYVVWTEEGMDRIKKFDNCGSFYIANLGDTSISEFYKKEWPALIDDEVKPYRSATYTGKPELRKTPQPCFREFVLHSELKEAQKKFNLFEISNDSEGENLNFKFNRTLKLVELYERMERIINSKEFIRE